MTIRQTITKKDGYDQIQNGYNNNYQPSTFKIPSCTFQDLDEAVIRLFDEQIKYSIKIVEWHDEGEEYSEKISFKKPIIMFAGGDRFAIAKKFKELRDKDKAFILPIISIKKSGINQSYEEMSNRGINQTTGEIVIRKKLDQELDLPYQQLNNKQNFKNLFSSGSYSTREPLTQGDNPLIKQGIYLEPNIKNNIFEIISVPSPQFYLATYEIEFWTSHTVHLNYMLEQMINSYLPQDRMFKIECEKGWWFLAKVGDNITPKDNFDDYTDDKKIVRASFELEVKGYLIASDNPDNLVPIKRYISAPMIELKITDDTGIESHIKSNLDKNVKDDLFRLTDIGEDLESAQIKNEAEKNVEKKYLENGEIKYIPQDQKYSRKTVKESVYKAKNQKELMKMLFPVKNK